jgi:hypothetical protein
VGRAYRDPRIICGVDLRHNHGGCPGIERQPNLGCIHRSHSHGERMPGAGQNPPGIYDRATVELPVLRVERDPVKRRSRQHAEGHRVVDRAPHPAGVGRECAGGVRKGGVGELGHILSIPPPADSHTGSDTVSYMFRLIKYLPAIIVFLRSPKGKAAIAKVRSTQQRVAARNARRHNR